MGKKLSPETWSEAQWEEARNKTRKRRNLYRVLAVVCFCCGGLGALLPFGKLAQCYGSGYHELMTGESGTYRGAGWALLGFLMSWLLVFLSEKASFLEGLNRAKIVYPSEVR